LVARAGLGMVCKAYVHLWPLGAASQAGGRIALRSRWC